MISVKRLPLPTTSDQVESLLDLQAIFAKACNATALVVRESRIWNRVALHHLIYRQLRTQFPTLGSQMACNAILAVSRTSRLAFQHPKSPFNVHRNTDKPLPILRFDNTAPVFFDRHTFSMRDGVASIFTPRGRIHAKLDLSEADRLHFKTHRLREIVLSLRKEQQFELSFWFLEAAMTDAPLPVNALPPSNISDDTPGMLPGYVTVEEHA
jgi:hypothetical protein